MGKNKGNRVTGPETAAELGAFDAHPHQESLFYQHCLQTLVLHTFHSFLSASIRNPSLSLQVTPESSVGGVLIRSSLPWPRLERERLTVCLPFTMPWEGAGQGVYKTPSQR